MSDLSDRERWVKVQTVPPYMILCVIIYLMSPMQRLLRYYKLGKLSITCRQPDSHITFCFVRLLYKFRIICRTFCVVPVLHLNCKWPRSQGGWDLWICYIPKCGGRKCFCFIRKTQGYAINTPWILKQRTVLQKINQKRQYLDISYQSLFMNPYLF